MPDPEHFETNLREFADALPVQIWMADPSKERTYFNERWLAFTGRPIEDELREGWIEDIYPDDVQRYLEIYRTSFDARKPFEHEYRLRRHDGAYRWIVDHGVPLLDANGTFNGYIGSFMDIHERRLLEDQVRFLAEASPVLTSSLDYEKTLGTVASLMVPDLADWCAVDMLQKDGEIKVVAVAHVDPEKVRFAYELREKYPVELNTASGVARVIQSGEPEFYPDISEEMLVQVARDEEHLEIIRRIGFHSALIVPLKAREQILGAMTLVWSETVRHYTESDLRFAQELARRAAIVVDNARLYHEAEEARSALQALNRSLEARVAERTDELTEANNNLLEEIKERTRAQHAVNRANTLLEHRNRELQDFAYVASHDLQEPLRKIQAFSNLLTEEYGDKIGDGRPYLERIENAADRMIGLIRDLLAFSRVALKGDEFKDVDLDSIVEEVLGDLEIRLAETEGRVDVGDLCTLEADEVQMRQLFLNLIGNALKFHREDVPPVVSIRSRLMADECVIEVQDNGIGFEEKYLDRIFAPFQRLHTSTTYGGTGIGLAICRRIIERHDGSIQAKSRPGSGSTFVVRLPLKHRHPADSELDNGASAA